AGERGRPAHDCSKSASLERRRRLEERLQQPRPHAGRGSRQAPRRVRQGQADRARAAQEGGGGLKSPTPSPRAKPRGLFSSRNKKGPSTARFALRSGRRKI